MKLGLGKVLDWAKKIGKWLHFSKLGMGHSESLRLSGCSSYFLPNSTSFECAWWNRVTKIDGLYSCGPPWEQEDALEAADKYAHAVVIGNLSSLRRFLIISMRRTDNKEVYLTRFLENLLNGKGKDNAYKNLKNILKTNSINVREIRKCSKTIVNRIIKMMLGITRRRECLCDAWAMDDKLWVPKKSIIY